MRYTIDALRTKPEFLRPFSLLAGVPNGPDINVVPYYSGSFQRAHDQMSHASEWDLPALQALVGASPARVVDAGSGSGRVSRHFAELGHTVLAVDNSADALAQLTSRLAPGDPVADRIDTLCADLAALWEAPEREAPGLLADYAIFGDVSINCFTPQGLGTVVRNLKSLMQPSGVICLTVFGDAALDGMLRFEDGTPAEPSWVDDGSGPPLLVWAAIRFQPDSGTLLRQFLMHDPDDPGRLNLAHAEDTIWTRTRLDLRMSELGFRVSAEELCNVGDGGAAGWPVYAVKYEPVS